MLGPCLLLSVVFFFGWTESPEGVKVWELPLLRP